MLPLTLLLSTILLFQLAFSQSADSQTVSIQDDPAWTSQRTCALNCLDEFDSGPEILAEYMECPTDPVENNCFCRTDLQASAESIIRSCVNQYCQATVDVDSAVSMYDAYCTSAGFVREAAAVTTAMSDSSIQSTTPIGAVATAQSSPTQALSTTPASPDSNAGGSKLGTSDIIGIVVGVLSFVAGACGAWSGYKALRNRP